MSEVILSKETTLAPPLPEENNRWHLDKRVSVGHLITTVAMVAAMSLWLIRLEGRIDLADQRIDTVMINIARVDVDRKLRDVEIISRLERLQDTLAEHERNTPNTHKQGN